VRITTVASVVAVSLLLPAGLGGAQSDTVEGWVLYAPNSARKVTLMRNGLLLASLEVPTGTTMVAVYDQRQPTSFAPGRWEFHGEFSLHAQAARDMAPLREPGGRVGQIRAEAPLVVSAKGVDVLMENIAP
jgi:hypothetical protein